LDTFNRGEHELRGEFLDRITGFFYLATENTGDTGVSAGNVYSTNLSCKASFSESFVIVHKVNAVDLRQFCRCLPKQLYKMRIPSTMLRINGTNLIDYRLSRVEMS
jgi:hypothetical protein